MDIHSPQAGDDTRTLNNYINTLGRQVKVNILSPQKIELIIDRKLDENEVVSLALTYNSNWKLENTKGKIKADVLGNMVVKLEEDTEKIILKYQESWLGSIFSFIIGLCGLLIMYQSEKLFHWVQIRFPSLRISKVNEDTDY